MGNLCSATIGIPNGWGLLSLIIALNCKETKHVKLQRANDQTECDNKTSLLDWIALLPKALKHPMPCTDMVPTPADYRGYCDTSKAGAGGVWFGLEKKLPAIVWRVKFPKEI